MYKRSMQGWLKHLDFILLDVLCLQIAFAASYLVRFGPGNPYGDDTYRDMAMLLTLMDLVVSAFFGSFTGVLRRGRYRELVMTVRHVGLMAVLVTFYMFSAHISGTYSRFMYYALFIFYLVLSFLARLAWKRYLLSRPAADQCSLFLVAASETAGEAVESVCGHGRGAYRMMGMAVVDRDMRGQEIAGVRVRAQRDDILEYLRQEYVDEVLIALPDTEPVPEGLAEDLVGMGIVVHERLNCRPGDVPVTYADNIALEKDYGFRPTVDIRTGLRKFVEWYKGYYIDRDNF